MLAESVLLSLVGAGAGLVLAWWAMIALRTTVAERLPIARLEEVGIDGKVLLFTIAAALVSAFIFGIAPALTSAGAKLTDTLKDGGRSGSAARGARVRGAFVVVEMALALVLLVGAGLLLRSFVDAAPRRSRASIPSRTMTVKVSIPQAKYTNAAQQQAFFNQLFERFDALPGVTAAGGTSFLPLNGLGSATGFEIVGKPKPAAGQEPVTDVRVITHDYFKAMGVPLLRGRAFDGRDAGTGVRRVIVNQTLAKKYFPGEDPIGKSIIVSWNDEVPDEIVGVVGDVRQQDLETEARATIYWPPARFTYPFMTIAIRTAGDPRGVVAPAVAALHDLDPNVAAADVQDDGGRDRHLRRAAAADDAAAVDLRGAGAGAGGGRDLRRDRIFRVAAHAGDRDPHGARRAARRGAADGGRTGDGAGADRRRRSAPWAPGCSPG